MSSAVFYACVDMMEVYIEDFFQCVVLSIQCTHSVCSSGFLSRCLRVIPVERAVRQTHSESLKSTTMKMGRWVV